MRSVGSWQIWYVENCTKSSNVTSTTFFFCLPFFHCSLFVCFCQESFFSIWTLLLLHHPVGGHGLFYDASRIDVDPRRFHTLCSRVAFGGTSHYAVVTELTSLLVWAYRHRFLIGIATRNSSALATDVANFFRQLLINYFPESLRYRLREQVMVMIPREVIIGESDWGCAAPYKSIDDLRAGLSRLGPDTHDLLLVIVDDHPHIYNVQEASFLSTHIPSSSFILNLPLFPFSPDAFCSVHFAELPPSVFLIQRASYAPTLFVAAQSASRNSITAAHQLFSLDNEGIIDLNQRSDRTFYSLFNTVTGFFHQQCPGSSAMHADLTRMWRIDNHGLPNPKRGDRNWQFAFSDW